MPGIFTTLIIIALALSADLIVETAAEMAADSVLDIEAGAVVDIAVGPPTEIVDLSPQATIRWPR